LKWVGDFYKEERTHILHFDTGRKCKEGRSLNVRGKDNVKKREGRVGGSVWGICKESEYFSVLIGPSVGSKWSKSPKGMEPQMGETRFVLRFGAS